MRHRHVKYLSKEKRTALACAMEIASPDVTLVRRHTRGTTCTHRAEFMGYYIPMYISKPDERGDPFRWYDGTNVGWGSWSACVVRFLQRG